MFGSSQLPQAGDVVEKARAYWIRFAAAIALACFWIGARSCRNDDAPLRVKPWKALTRADAFDGFMMSIVWTVVVDGPQCRRTVAPEILHCQ